MLIHKSHKSLLVRYKMAARTDAAACSIEFFLFLLSVSYVFSFRKHVYSRHELLDIGHSHRSTRTAVSSRSHDIPHATARPPGAPWIVVGAGRRRRRQKERKQKQGCQSGLLATLRRNPHKPPFPSVSHQRTILDPQNGRARTTHRG